MRGVRYFLSIFDNFFTRPTAAASVGAVVIGVLGHDAQIAQTDQFLWAYLSVLAAIALAAAVAAARVDVFTRAGAIVVVNPIKTQHLPTDAVVEVGFTDRFWLQHSVVELRTADGAARVPVYALRFDQAGERLSQLLDEMSR